MPFFSLAAPHTDEEVPLIETSEETITLEGEDISPEKMTPEKSEVVSMETTREDLTGVEKEEVSFEFITPEKMKVSHEEIVAEESPLPEEDKVAPTATVEEISMATTMEVEEVIPKDKLPEEVSEITTETELSLPTEELKDVRKAPEEEVINACRVIFHTLLLFADFVQN